jgi:IclR family acetate operon transcriptional repressor
VRRADDPVPERAAVAAPIRTLDAEVIAAIPASGPTFWINDESLAGIAEDVVAAAAGISQRHGYPRRG